MRCSGLLDRQIKSRVFLGTLHPGTLFLHGAATFELDPFGADLVQMPHLFAMWGKGRFAVRQRLGSPRLTFLTVNL